MNWRIKLAEVTPGAAASPIPQVEVNPQKAPGQTGPRGLAPRTNYTRLNSGAPPPPDAGAAAQKSAPPMGATMLPKLASEDSMATASRTPTLQEMVKAAMDSTQTRVSIAAEASRQASYGSEKVAAEECKKCGKAPCKCDEKTASVSTDYAEKFASALEYILPMLKESMPGEGPNAQQVMEAKAEGQLPANHGQAHKQPPGPGAQQKTTPAGPATQMANSMEHPVAGKMIQKNASATLKALSKVAEDEKLEKEESKGMKKIEKGLEEAEKAHGKEGDEKKASLVDAMIATVKKAEDAINPAKISAGAAVAPETSAAGESGGAPAGGTPQGPTGLVGSNESAKTYNRAEARSNRKSDMAKYITEPMQSNATDHTLKDVLVHSSAADGNKFAGAKEAAFKTAAARTLLAKLAGEEQAKDDKKKKLEEKTSGETC